MQGINERKAGQSVGADRQISGNNEAVEPCATSLQRTTTADHDGYSINVYQHNVLLRI
jgi:hypothetical protein